MRNFNLKFKDSGEFVRSFCASKGWTVSDLAKYLKISVSCARKYYRGKRYLDPTRLELSS